jgi:hypothetical protein
MDYPDKKLNITDKGNSGKKQEPKALRVGSSPSPRPGSGGPPAPMSPSGMAAADTIFVFSFVFSENPPEGIK